MKIIQNEAFPEKVNFVDENNRFVGYDLSQDCCEQADWFISEKIESGIPENIDELQKFDVSKYQFDPSFNIKEYSGSEIDSLDAGGMLVFRLEKRNEHHKKLNWLSDIQIYKYEGGMATGCISPPEDTINEFDYAFLHIFNAHNSYYGHGFEYDIRDGEKLIQVREGCL